MIRIDCDKQWKVIAKETRLSGLGGALPRPHKHRYGHSPGLIPYGEAFPDELVDPKDFKEVIQHCHDEQIFPMYHQRDTWGPPGYRWSQNGLPYCWAWGLTAALMDCQAREGRHEDGGVKLLAPVSLGFCVGWKSRGNYLDDAVRGAKDRGICEARFVPNQHSRQYRSYEDGWEANAKQNRVAEAWDTDPRRMLQPCLTIQLRQPASPLR